MTENRLDILALIKACSPSKRKSCKICNKFTYFHQPVLFCVSCLKIYHGKCLNFKNNDIFVLQQLNFSCPDCTTKDNSIECVCCKVSVDVYNDKFIQCKNCYLLIHKHCSFHNCCLQCIPEFKPKAEVVDTYRSNIISEYYNNLPVFCPFHVTENKQNCNLIDTDEGSNDIQYASQVLRSCQYLDLQMFRNTYLSHMNKNSFVCLSLNIDGFKTNFDKFAIFHRALVQYSCKISCYLLCESNIIKDQAGPFYLQGYNKFVLDKIKISNNIYKNKGSGIVLYLDNKINNVEVCDDLSETTTDGEFSVVRFKLKKYTHYIIGVYRPPSGKPSVFLENLDKILLCINSSKHVKCTFLGDFNFNLYNSSSRYVLSYLDTIFSQGVYPTVSRATHFMAREPTCIDHILTNDICNVIVTGVITYKISHHMPIFSIYNLADDLFDNRVSSRPKLMINEQTLMSFSNEIYVLRSKYEIESDVSARDHFTQFIKDFKNTYDKWFVNDNMHANVHKRNYVRKDWITVGIAKSCEEKNRLYSKWCKSKCSSDWNDYLAYKRKLDVLIKKSKFDYFQKEFENCKSDLKKTWQTINNILGRKKRDSLLIFTDKDASHSFNKYFTSIANELIKDNYNNTSDIDSYSTYLPPISTTINSLVIKPDKIKYFIDKLNNCKSTYFAPRILKYVSTDLSLLLTSIFDKCYTEGYFPDELKIAKVIPLYKNKGPMTDIGNYRAISMLSVFSKLFEKVIHRHISDYLEENNIINPAQYGFRTGHSTVHALVNATENVHKSLENNMYTLGVFIDFSKAFDTINHEILVKKLEHYGIHGNLLKLLTNYMQNRKQYVIYGGTNSELLDITCGVPQGSVLGPLMFILFVNDLPNIYNDITAQFVLFADDANIFLSHTVRKVLYQLANEVLHNLYKYCVANRLIINYKKCCYMEFTKNQCTNSNDDYTLHILGNKFEKQSECKFLGVTITADLNWDTHIKHVKSQVSKALGSMYALRSCVPQKVLRKIYFSLFQSYLLYCIHIWGSKHNSVSFNDLFVIQKKALRLICNKTLRHACFKLENTKPLFKVTNILSIHNLYYYMIATESSKILNTQKPQRIFDLFECSHSVYSDRIILPKFSKASLCSKSFIFNSSKFQNYLISEGISYATTSYESYKKYVKSHLMMRQSISLKNCNDWLPCNLNPYSEVVS